jgi:hypothetical protein
MAKSGPEIMVSLDLSLTHKHGGGNKASNDKSTQTETRSLIRINMSITSKSRVDVTQPSNTSTIRENFLRLF